MEFRTKVDIPRPTFSIGPNIEMLFVGSCFADSLGKRFQEDKFRAKVNPYGVMYNPVSIMHTVERIMTDDTEFMPETAIFTLGTNHIYRLKETGEIVDNCRKRPQKLFNEEELTIDECVKCLLKAVEILQNRNSNIRIIITVSPIRYAKYGFHGSRLSKATLLLAADMLVKENPACTYFPAYEIMNDELRDYRFYREDMLHPSDQAVEYIWQLFSEAYFSDAARCFINEWRPIKDAIGHKPFNAESEEYKAFWDKTMRKVADLSEKYPNFAL
ncbi:GSCFA domain-containing protein [Xylanibacter muris]|uniref:GSCFA domain-containing protein n=1 Tax=Xylanibacter muris TaxID=2736290 RepID=A0ABX2AKV4_9BACT|nr:GSCFA domain-containing protein [Xylanibacter muris]NPD91851.1 GSCFA domain-containing protein [Xylanibacter muris]